MSTTTYTPINNNACSFEYEGSETVVCVAQDNSGMDVFLTHNEQKPKLLSLRKFDNSSLIAVFVSPSTTSANREDYVYDSCLGIIYSIHKNGQLFFVDIGKIGDEENGNYTTSFPDYPITIPNGRGFTVGLATIIVPTNQKLTVHHVDHDVFANTGVLTITTTRTVVVPHDLKQIKYNPLDNMLAWTSDGSVGVATTTQLDEFHGSSIVVQFVVEFWFVPSRLEWYPGNGVFLLVSSEKTGEYVILGLENDRFKVVQQDGNANRIIRPQFTTNNGTLFGLQSNNARMIRNHKVLQRLIVSDDCKIRSRNLDQNCCVTSLKGDKVYLRTCGGRFGGGVYYTVTYSNRRYVQPEDQVVISPVKYLPQKRSLSSLLSETILSTVLCARNALLGQISTPTAEDCNEDDVQNRPLSVGKFCSMRKEETWNIDDDDVALPSSSMESIEATKMEGQETLE